MPSGIGVRLYDNFTSNLLIQRFDERKWRDENRLNTFIFNKYDQDYIGFYINSWLLTDKQTVSTSRFSEHALGLKGIVRLGDVLSILPYAGYQRSENRTFIDWGWDVGMGADVNDLYLGDYRTNLNLQTDYDLYPQRENYSNHFDIRINKQFSRLAGDSLQVGYSRSKQEYYAYDSGNLVEVNIEEKNMHNVLDYRLSTRSLLELNTILIDRNIADNTPVNPNIRKVFRFENRFGYRYLSPAFIFFLGLNTFQETLDNLDIRTDSRALQTGIMTNFIINFSNDDQLDVQLNYIKYQYDTPDQVDNHDDRDELRLVGTSRYFHRFSELLWLDLFAYVNLFHKTYIFSEQSANNNWNRIFKIQSSVNYQYGHFRNALSTQVLANYTVYDYDQLFTTTRSFIFRRYSIADSLLSPLTYHTYLGVYIRLELEDRGSFFQEAFTQNLTETSQTLFYDLFLKKESVFALDVEAGVAVYQRKNWRYQPLSILSRNIKRISPYLRFIYPFGRHLRLYSQISHNFLNDEGREKSTYTFGQMDLYYQF